MVVSTPSYTCPIIQNNILVGSLVVVDSVCVPERWGSGSESRCYACRWFDSAIYVELYQPITGFVCLFDSSLLHIQLRENTEQHVDSAEHRGKGDLFMQCQLFSALSMLNWAACVVRCGGFLNGIKDLLYVA